MGGGVQKIYVTAFRTEDDEGGDVWRGAASTRTQLAAPGAGYNPITVDEEVLTEYRRLFGGAGGTVVGRVRLLGFLNPFDPLFFQAGNRAVTIADYALELTPVREEALAAPVSS